MDTQLCQDFFQPVCSRFHLDLAITQCAKRAIRAGSELDRYEVIRDLPFASRIAQANGANHLSYRDLATCSAAAVDGRFGYCKHRDCVIDDGRDRTLSNTICISLSVWIA